MIIESDVFKASSVEDIDEGSPLEVDGPEFVVVEAVVVEAVVVVVVEVVVAAGVEEELDVLDVPF